MRTRVKNRTYRVYLDGAWLDTVFVICGGKNKTEREEEMRRSLIGHDGYDHRIKVKEEGVCRI